LEYLTVTDANISDIADVSRLTSLIELDLWPSYGAHGTVDLGDLPRLGVLAIPRKLLRTVSSRHSLHTLLIEGPGVLEQSEVDCLPELAALRLAKIAPPPSLSATLESLSIHGIDWPANLTSLTGLGSLRRLELSGVSRLVDLSPFTAAEQLKELIVADCRHLESLAGVQLSDGCIVRVIGNTPARLRGK
jgi:hypothetical protein